MKHDTRDIFEFRQLKDTTRIMSGRDFSLVLITGCGSERLHLMR